MEDFENIINNLDLIKLTSITGITVSVFLGHKIFRESNAFFKIKKRLSTKNIKIQNSPKKLIQKEELYNKTSCIEPKYIKNIVEFYSTIKTELPHVDLTIYKRNIKSLKIKEVKRNNKKNSPACYISSINEISKLKNANSNVLNHELFHMSNGFNMVNSDFCGFAQYNEAMGFRVFGQGLNEGYTTLLDRRYFNYNNYCDKYQVLSIIANLIECIVGKEKMEKMYFDADLYNLVENLKEYNSRNNIVKLLNNMDILLNCCNNTIVEHYYCKKILPETTEILIKTYTTKQLKLYYNKEISELDMWNRILFFTNIIDSVVEINNKQYTFSNISSVYETISKLSYTSVQDIKTKRKTMYS